MRWSAGRIRSEGNLFGLKDKRILFNAWIMGVLHSNALAFLPSLTEGQISALQTAMNAGIRAVLNLPRKSITSMTALRVKHGFLSVTDVRDKCLMLAAQKTEIIIYSAHKTWMVRTRGLSQEAKFLIQIVKDKLGWKHLNCNKQNLESYSKGDQGWA